ncbi:MAG: hypothetical protein ACR2IF_04580 [Terriglobales bacterium]
MAAPVVSPHVPSSRPNLLTRWLTFPAAINFLVFLVAFFNSLKGTIIEPDIWWHLRNAQLLVSSHSLPRFDQYSFTVAGSPWIDHEWLSELMYYGMFKLFGLQGLLLLMIAAAGAIFALLYYRCREAGANPKTASIVMILGVLVASVVFGPRPHLLGWLCMSVLLVLLERFADHRSAPLWVLPPLFCLWVNLHGSWLFGLIVLSTFLICGLARLDWGLIAAEPMPAPDLRKLAVAAAASVGALFINPFGYRLVAYPFDLLFRQTSNMANIDEWRSVDFHDPRGKIVMLLLIVLFTCALAGHKKWKLREALLVLFALYVSLTYWRMQFFAALIFVPLISTRLPLFPAYDEKKEKPILNAILIAGVILIMLVKFPGARALNDQIARVYPERALAFMRAHGLTERVLNDYGWGGYIIWHEPEMKTFIDGRADLFVYKGVFDDYVKLVTTGEEFELLDRYRIQTALVKPSNKISYMLGHSSCWRSTYSDEIAVVYQRIPGECKLGYPIDRH